MTVVLDNIQVGPVNNGHQSIIIPDSKKNAHIQCNATKQEVDEYLTTRNNITKNLGLKEFASIAGGTLLGIALGPAIKIKNFDVEGRRIVGAFGGIVLGGIVSFLIDLSATGKINNLNNSFIEKHSN